MDYNNGKLYGLNEDFVPSKTILTFMIKCLCGKYEDVVSLKTVTKLNSKILKQYYDPILQVVHKAGFRVSGRLVDNYSANCKFVFDELLSGSPSNYYIHSSEGESWEKNSYF
uniref:Transposable element P transposase-like RNase H domain-containing protein n=1 Tax=Lepeophtheirus salmonis TaxID=72036 RepID=A0A0K2T9H1_LEPSM